MSVFVKTIGSAETTETWLWNSTLTPSSFPSSSSGTQYNVAFTSGSGTSYTAISVNHRTSSECSMFYINTTGTTSVYSASAGWYSQDNRTIILDEPATGDLLSVLQANAIKQ